MTITRDIKSMVVHGQALCSPDWPAYYHPWLPSSHEAAMGMKNVSSFYIRNDTNDGTQLVEIGFANSWSTWNKQGRRDDRPSWIFRAVENAPNDQAYLVLPREESVYNDSPYVSGQPGTWVYFEINNHTMDSSTGSWYAAWNGNTVLRGWSAPGFTRGRAQVAAERWGTRKPSVPDVRLDSRFRYMFYKRNAEHQWAAWNGGDRWDSDQYWHIIQESGYSNRFRVYQDLAY